MKAYRNIHQNSGIRYYEIDEHSIKIKFKHSSSVYIYHDSKIAKTHIDRMKALAKEGKGLATYISQHPEVRDHYFIQK
jgi:hypothetical protein